jgi:hypothetical protein
MYSGKEIIKAGEKLLDVDLITKDSAAYLAAMDILSYWRFSHEGPLEIAFKLLQEVAQKKDKSTIFAKRLKRYVSIVAKLRRYEKMKLKNMQDIGGCRAIVANEKRLLQLVRELRKKPQFKGRGGKIRSKDYVSNPKQDGYRGYHLIGNFGDGNDQKSIEIQVRTSLQHDWATALEIVDLFTGQALKSNQGNADWEVFFRYVSEQFAVMESIHLFDTLSKEKKYAIYREVILGNKNNIEACRRTQEYCSKLNVIARLQAFAYSLDIINARLSEVPVSGYALVEVNTEKKQVRSTLYSDDLNSEAEARYIELEKTAAIKPHLVVALVSTTAVGGIKEAYPNYFADSTDFVQHLFFITSIHLPLKRRVSWNKIWQNLFKSSKLD